MERLDIFTYIHPILKLQKLILSYVMSPQLFTFTAFIMFENVWWLRNMILFKGHNSFTQFIICDINQRISEFKHLILENT